MTFDLKSYKLDKINNVNLWKLESFGFYQLAAMGFEKILLAVTYIVIIDGLVINDEIDINEEIKSDLTNVSDKSIENTNDVFNGVYSDCFLGMSFICLQKKTLLYLKELNKLNEVSVIGDYLKFVRLNTSENPPEEEITGESSEELSNRIDKAVDNFFDNHLIRFSALGKDFVVPRKEPKKLRIVKQKDDRLNIVEEFVGRKRRKGGGGGGGHGGGDGGKKKMMMMAMMCMKMKLMMMVPAMMGMMGMMSFKGMMFSMMTFMISKMMLLMKILEKKAGGGGGGGGGYGGDGGWAAGGGGGAWMPAGQDYGSAGGYDANGQWQSRSIIEEQKDVPYGNRGAMSYVKPLARFNNKENDEKALTLLKKINDGIVQVDKAPLKRRKKRGVMDALQNAYLFWTSKVLGTGPKKHFYPKYKIINGMKYVYSPIRNVLKFKSPKELKPIKENEETPIITIDSYNKGEITEGAVEGRMNRRKFHTMKENVNETMDENPWE